MEGEDGGCGPWSYGDETGSTGSDTNSSGTVSSSYMFPISVETAMHLNSEFIDDDESADKSRKEIAKEKMEKIKGLVTEFFGAASANCSINGRDMSVVERWFEELGVVWVLDIADGSSTVELDPAVATRIWIRALSEIVESVSFTILCEEGPVTESEKQAIIPDQFLLARFIQQAMLKMVAFVDFIIIAPDPNTNGDVLVSNNRVLVPYKKLSALLGVRDILSKASCHLWLPSDSPRHTQVERIESEIVSLLSAKKGQVGEHIRSAMEEIRTRILETIGDESSGSEPLQGSSEVHKATRSVIRYIKFLRANYSLVAPIVSEAARLGKYVPEIGTLPPLISLAKEMTTSVEEKLAKKSFPDQSLRFLFLLNNSYFIREQLLQSWCYPSVHVAAVTRKVKGYMESYLQISWAPVVSCLFSPTHLCHGIACSLPKFEAEFQRTYTTQKLWKVPDPKLRETLRVAITDKIVPGYTEYIEENNVTTPKLFTPRKLEDMLKELFEG